MALIKSITDGFDAELAAHVDVAFSEMIRDALRGDDSVVKSSFVGAQNVGVCEELIVTYPHVR